MVHTGHGSIIYEPLMIRIMKIKRLSLIGIVLSFLPSCYLREKAPLKIENNSVEVILLNTERTLWKYRVKSTAEEMQIAPPIFEIDGKNRICALADITTRSEPVKLKNNVTEYTFSGPVRDDRTLVLTLVFRIAPDNPVIRFRYILSGTSGHKLTKQSGQDDLTYFRTSLADFTKIKEIQFSNFDEKYHAYVLAEQPIEDRHFDDHFGFMGPMLTAHKGNSSFLLAYEHGSQYNNPFLRFDLNPDFTVSLAALKGNYLTNQVVSSDSVYETIWFEIAGTEGSEDDLAAGYRAFILKYISLNASSRKPYIYYNTWGRQERIKWQGGKYLQSMNLKQTLAEIEKLHKTGVDVYVLDAGWFLKTGDWMVNTSENFFPDSLLQVTALIKKYNMQLGLWFNPTLAALSSKVLNDNRECRSRRDGKLQADFPVWETENSVNMCLVSEFWKDFADEMIRLSKELNVTYFKWDGVDQGDCDASGHFHGTAENSILERNDNAAFLQPVYMAKIVDRVFESCPEAIFDFDITEKGRCVGVAFLASGRFHAVNNGPYYHNLDLARPWETPLSNGNVNMFVYPGPARGWFTRSILTFDKWIPSILFLTHYQLDGSESSRINNAASLILGQNGIWGEIVKIPDDDLKLTSEILRKYKQVCNDITTASPVTYGHPGEMTEIHEKINPENGKGTVVIFNNGNKPIRYVTENKPDKRFWSTGDVKISFDERGRAVIEAGFPEADAKIIFFGVIN